MKKAFILILALCSIMSVTSCDDWLTATSSTKIPADKLFETRGGFCDALSGVYISMGSTAEYGSIMSFSYLDFVSYPYIYSSTTSKKSMQQHEYTGVSFKKNVSSLWLGLYQSIANINEALIMLESHRDAIVVEEEYKLFKGELLALRAYLHLDLMRVFGTGVLDEATMAKKTIPYLTTFSKEPTPQKTYEETIGLLLQDINDAIECLEASDPIAGVVSEDIVASINQDGFWSNRRLHVNYYCALAIKARVLQWKGDLEGAGELAQKIISESFDKGVINWTDKEALIAAGGNSIDRDKFYEAEQLFSLEISKLADKALETISSTTVDAQYIISADFIDNVLYQRIDSETGSLAGSEDVRGPLFNLAYSALGYSSTKYYNYESSPSFNKFPMVRISEIYYILAESQIAAGNNEAALATLDAVRRNRGISDTFPTTANAEDELMKEYYREFVGEGKLFFYLKHKNVSSSLNSSFSLKASDLIFPYPDEEINYGRVQEL